MRPADSVIRLFSVAILACAPGMADSEPWDDTDSPAPATVSIAECDVNGFVLGDTPHRMKELFGEPDGLSAARPESARGTPFKYRYDGLRIEFSSSGRSAMGFHVTSPAYRLASGVGVGSSWAEILDAYGPGALIAWGNRNSYSLQIVESNGKRIPATLTFRLVDEVVVEFFVSTGS